MLPFEYGWKLDFNSCILRHNPTIHVRSAIPVPAKGAKETRRLWDALDRMDKKK